MNENKEENCIKIPIQCSIINPNTSLCRRCNKGYYPIKQDINRGYFNCYKNIEEIISDINKTNYYLNETKKYWDECYYSCVSCYSYDSENRQKCKIRKVVIIWIIISNKIYNNCRINLILNENCTSTQVDMYKYKDFCLLWQNDILLFLELMYIIKMKN
jgi:hypothetical protein